MLRGVIGSRQAISGWNQNVCIDVCMSEITVILMSACRSRGVLVLSTQSISVSVVPHPRGGQVQFELYDFDCCKVEEQRQLHKRSIDLIYVYKSIYLIYVYKSIYLIYVYKSDICLQIYLSIDL